MTGAGVSFDFETFGSLIDLTLLQKSLLLEFPSGLES